MADLLTGQVELAGVLMGRGTPINFIDFTGFGRPPVRDNDTDRPGMDGGWAGPDYWAARTVQFDAAIKIPGDGPACEAVLATLEEACASSAARLTSGSGVVLRVRRPGSALVKRLVGRVRRIDPEYARVIYGYMPLDIEFVAHDPLWYADTEQVTEIPLGWLTGGGFAAPIVAPIYVQDGATAADRPGWVTTYGTTNTFPVIRVTGPCADVTITHVASGRKLALPTLVLGPGQWVDIDTRPGFCTVTRENGGNASTTMSPGSRIDQFVLPPGLSELRWTAFDNTQTARLRLTWRDAYTAL